MVVALFDSIALTPSLLVFSGGGNGARRMISDYEFIPDSEALYETVGCLGEIFVGLSPLYSDANK